jgi:glutathione S-transferase
MGVPYRVSPVGFPPSEAYRALHPLGSVPYLEDDTAGGAKLSESIAIMLYVAEKYGPTPLMPGKEDARFGPMLELTMFGEAGVGAPVNSLLAAHFMAPAEDKRNWTVRGQESRVERSVRYVGDRLTANEVANEVAGGSEAASEAASGNGGFLVGRELTLADISVSCAVSIWRGALGKELPENVQAYMERMAARPAYQRAVKANT